MKQLITKIKKALYFCLYYLGGFRIGFFLLNLLRKDHGCIILLYHRIVDEKTVFLDKGPAIHHRIEDFRREICFLKRNYYIASIEEVVENLRKGRAFPRPTIAITFDDGYLDNYTLAYPILKKQNLRATIYVTTALIGTGERTWTDVIERALLETKKERLRIIGLCGGCIFPIGSAADKRRACIEIAGALKKVPDEERIGILRQIIETLGVSTSDKHPEYSRMMLNWDELRDMAGNGITIGSHTQTHPILSKMPLEQARDEIRISKELLEMELGTKIENFAFPNGRVEDFSAELEEYCGAIGIKSIASAIHGVNLRNEKNPASLERIVATSPVWLMAGELLMEFIKANIKAK